MTLKDLLWVLTESQLTAAVSFTDALRGIIRKSNEQSEGHRAAASGMVCCTVALRYRFFFHKGCQLGKFHPKALIPQGIDLTGH